MEWIACIFVGGAVATLAAWLLTAATTPGDPGAEEWRYDRVRIAELSRQQLLYRVLRPAFAALAPLNRSLFKPSLPEIQREILAAGLSKYWLPEEYLARCEILACLALPGLVAACIGIVGPTGIVLAVVLAGLTAWLLRRQLAAQARTRLALIKRRLPFFLDMLTLLMEAGSALLQALEESVHEFRGQPVAEEFGRVLSDIRLGRTRTEALLAMRERLQDGDVGSVIGSIVQGENLGTPLATVFRMQADVLRIRRTQRAETIAGEAGVQMLLPGVLVMAAAVLVILGPFVLNYWSSGFNL
jgi:tight adherence protein C